MIDEKKIKKYYGHVLNQVYAETESPFHKQLTAEVYQQIIQPLNLDKDAQILDVGCGPGYFLEQCEQNGYKNAAGTVGTKDELKALKKKKLKASIEDISFLSNKDESIDFIFCRQVLEHSPWPYITLMEYNRILKMGAKMYIETPCPDSDDRMHENNVNHYSVMGARMLHNLIARAGFKIDGAFDLNMPIVNQETGKQMQETGFGVIAIKEAYCPTK